MKNESCVPIPVPSCQCLVTRLIHLPRVPLQVQIRLHFQTDASYILFCPTQTQSLSFRWEDGRGSGLDFTVVKIRIMARNFSCLFKCFESQIVALWRQMRYPRYLVILIFDKKLYTGHLKRRTQADEVPLRNTGDVATIHETLFRCMFVSSALRIRWSSPPSGIQQEPQ